MTNVLLSSRGGSPVTVLEGLPAERVSHDPHQPPRRLLSKGGPLGLLLTHPDNPQTSQAWASPLYPLTSGTTQETRVLDYGTGTRAASVGDVGFGLLVRVALLCPLLVPTF